MRVDRVLGVGEEERCFATLVISLVPMEIFPIYNAKLTSESGQTWSNGTTVTVKIEQLQSRNYPKYFIRKQFHVQDI